MAVTQAATYILLALFFVFVVFLSDALWGDTVARWMAVGYSVLAVIVAGVSSAGLTGRDRSV